LGEFESANEGGTFSDHYRLLLPPGWEGGVDYRQFCSEICEARFLQRQFAAKVKALEAEAKEENGPSPKVRPMSEEDCADREET